MCRRLSIPLALVAVLALAGCKTSLSGESEEAKAKQAALEAEARKKEEVEAAHEGRRAKARAAEEAAAAVAKDGADVGEPVEAAPEPEDPRLESFAERLEKAGFGPLGREVLLPDVLGGLELCNASLRTKLSFDKGYATMGRYPDAAAAKGCLDVYLTMPGAAKYKHLYLLEGAYMLEMHPSLQAKDMGAIREAFKAAVRG
ncbi:MAG TPA: hypothetical protein VN033_01270 [Vulgatibacter sp.]|nr:hypothetical protein [Vulgatibacter sp.]